MVACKRLLTVRRKPIGSSILPSRAMKNITTLKKSRITPGIWVRTMWDDVGARDGIVVEKIDNKSIRVYTPHDKNALMTEISQVVAIGNYLDAKESGL